MSKVSQIILPEQRQAKQFNLLGRSTSFDKWFPPVYSNDPAKFHEVLNNALSEGYLGLDFEFPPTYRASLIGISSKNACACIRPTDETIRQVVQAALQRGVKIVGHSVIGAEKKVIEVNTGIVLPLGSYDDTMLRHYLLNADLAKAPDKSEADDAGALGFMNLWTATSMVLDVPMWKMCRGFACEGIICPTHDVEGYCAVDSWSSLELNYAHITGMAHHRVPEKLYEELKELTEIAQTMQDRGIKINTLWVREFDSKSDEYKEKLFQGQGLFNPRSPQAVVSWFKDNNVILGSNSKKDIRKTLEKQAEKRGFSLKDNDGRFTTEALENAEELPKELDALLRLYQYKDAGKGLDSWFGDKYISDGFVHPRFITIGASTSRWSSSRPNFTNIPARGFGSLVKAGIIPRDESLDIVHADASNLELRICLYLGGVDPTELFGDKDPFKWLVVESAGKFEKAASENNMVARDVAKSVSHASNYLEGIKILYAKDLSDPRIKREIEDGILYVYRDWEYCGGIVSFTGANLAERLFGSKSAENRRKALQISEEIYFKQLPQLRAWHRKVLREIEDTQRVQYPTGHFLRLYGRPEENAKVGMAAYGQGCGAHHVQGILLRFVRTTGYVPIMFTHDSFDFEVPRTWSDKQANEFMYIMAEETDRFPGLKTPYKAARGRIALEYNEKKPETDLPGAMRPL